MIKRPYLLWPIRRLLLEEDNLDAAIQDRGA